MTRRQEDVLELVASGLCDKEIARALGVEYRTVRCYLDRVGAATGLRGRTAIAAHWLLSPACSDEQRARIRARLGVA